MTEGTHHPKRSDVPDWRRKGSKVGLTIIKKVACPRAAAHLLRLGDKARVRTSRQTGSTIASSLTIRPGPIGRICSDQSLPPPRL